METANNRLIIKNTIFLYLRMVVVLGVSLYTTRAFLKILGVEDFGIYNVVGGFVSMFAFLSTMISNATLRFYNYALGKEGESGIKKVYNISLLLQVGFFAVLLLILETIGLWYINYKMVIPESRLGVANWLFQFSIISMGLQMLNVPHNASIMAHERMGYFALVSVIDAILNLIIVSCLLISDYDKLLVYGVLKMCVVLANFFLNFFYCRIKFSSMRINFEVEKPLLKEMFGFFGWNVFGTFSFMMKEQGVNMILNIFFGPVVNAARGVAVQVSNALQQFISNNNVAVAPQMVKSYAQGDEERSVSLMMTVSKLNFVLLLLIALPISLEIDYILNLWLDGNVPDGTSIFTVLVFCCYIINNWNAPVSNLTYATGKMKSYQLASTIILFILPICYLVFSLGADAYWAFVIMFVVSSVHHAVSLCILKTLVNFSIKQYVVQVVFPAIVVIVVSIWPPLLVCQMLQTGFLRLCIVTLVSVLCVAGSAYAFVLTKSERSMLMVMIKQKLHIK